MLKIAKMLAVAVVAGALMAGGVYANDAGKSCDDREKKHGEMFDKMTKELGLTADQQAKLKANKEANRAKMQSLREAMKVNRAKFKDAVKQPGATRASVEPIVAEMKALQGQMADQMVDGIFAAKEVLTPEQFEKMQNKMEERMKEHKGKEGDWHHEKK
jgi:Spy/CpxP family protein refolding chaperone